MSEKGWTKNREFCFGVTGPLFIVVYPLDWQPETFTEYLDSMGELLSGSTPPLALVFATGRTLTPAERKLLMEHSQTRGVGQGHVRRTAVLTDSLVTRGVVTALSWLMPSKNGELSAFPPRAYIEALAWLASVEPSLDRAAAGALLRHLTVWANIDPRLLD
jgi:hypothetical protein